jgi:hypothetical protein
MCVLIFSTILSETFLILRRNEWDALINMHRSNYSCQILMKFEFSRQILEKCVSVRLVGNELFHVNGRTDMTKLTVFAIL